MDKSPQKVLIFKEHGHQLLELRSIGYFNHKEHIEHSKIQLNIYTSLYFISNGRAEMKMGENTYKLNKGHLFLCGPGISRKYIYYDDEPFEMYWIAMYGSTAAKVSKLLGLCEEKPVRFANNPEEISAILDNATNFDTPSTSAYYTAVSALMSILSLEAATHGMPVSNSEQYASIVTSVNDLIWRNYSNSDFSVKDIAMNLYMRHETMSRMYKQATGIPPSAALIEVRLYHASRLLNDQDYRIKELCEAVGFGDEKYFLKRFKKRFGVTIKEYRANKENKSR